MSWGFYSRHCQESDAQRTARTSASYTLWCMSISIWIQCCALHANSILDLMLATSADSQSEMLLSMTGRKIEDILFSFACLRHKRFYDFRLWQAINVAHRSSQSHRCPVRFQQCSMHLQRQPTIFLATSAALALKFVPSGATLLHA